MPDSKSYTAKISENFRRRRAEQEMAQVQIWMDQDLRDRVDQVAKAKGFRNRSDFINQLLSTQLESIV